MIFTFRWSGGNTHRARLHAAAALQRHILALAARYPNDDQFLVAHSHGGNVCLYALRDSCVRECVSGVVTLSTPFIVARRRDLGGAAFTSILILIVGVPVAAAIVWLAQFLSFLLLRVVILLILGGVLSMFIAIDLFVRRVFFGGKTHDEIYQNWRQSLALPELDAERLLIIRSSGDEASGALAVGHLAAWSLSAMSRRLNAVFSIGEWFSTLNDRWSPEWRTACASGLLVAGSVALCYAVFVRFDPLDVVWGTIFFGGVLATILGLSFARPFGFDLFLLIGLILQALCGALTLPLMLLLMVCALPFGADIALLSLLFDLSAESTPPGNFTVFQSAFVRPGTLSHSAPYENEETVVRVAEWLHARRHVAGRGA